MLFKDSTSLQWTFLKEEITVVSRDPFNITNTTACEQNPCNHVFEQVKLRHQRTVRSTAPTASGQERNNNCRRVRRWPFILPQNWTSQPQFGFSFYSSDSPGLRMSSIFRIILTICVARDICCFLPIRVSMTCCCFISEKHKQTRYPETERTFTISKGFWFKESQHLSEITNLEATSLIYIFRRIPLHYFQRHF